MDAQTKQFLINFGIAAAIVIGQIVIIGILWQVAKMISKRIVSHAAERFKPLIIKKLRLLTPQQISGFILLGIRILKYLITVFQLFITVPIVFSLFPRTERIASSIFEHILLPLRTIGSNIIHYLPNLITIIIILLITKYVLRALKFFSTQIAREKLKIPGFYHEWAYPTFNILRFLVYAFTVAMIFPYLPGSQSQAFQGVSVFVGIIVSLGSSTAIGNLVAGLVITYMRPFKLGDRIQIHGNIGFLVEKNLMVLRIKTHKNEYVTIPNLQALSANITNYNTSSDEDEEGLILNAEVTYNYATPWRVIHEILIEAALKTTCVLKNPKPFVLQTSLDNFYAAYQINCYTKEIEKIPAIYAELFENIQDGFVDRGLDMTSPGFSILLPESSRGTGPWTEHRPPETETARNQKKPGAKSEKPGKIFVPPSDNQDAQ